MPMIISFRAFALAALALLAALSFDSRKARAEVEYPWCAAYTGQARGIVTCGYVSFAQCMATVSGVGGFCQQNPRLMGAPYEPPRQRRVRHD